MAESETNAVKELTTERFLEIVDMSAHHWTDRRHRLENEEADEKEFERLSAKWNAKTAEFLKNTTEPMELHVFADNYNWDDGYDTLTKIIRNPACDLSTAKLIFWASGGYPTGEEAAAVDANWDYVALCREIIAMVKDGKFGDATIPFKLSDRLEKAEDHDMYNWPDTIVLCEDFPGPKLVPPPDPKDHADPRNFPDLPDDTEWEHL